MSEQSQEQEKTLLPKVVNTVRAASALAAQDVDFYRSIDKDIAHSLEQSSNQIADMINSVLLSIDENSEQVDGTKENLEDIWKDFGNLMDNLFEKSDRSIDIITRGHGGSNGQSGMQYIDEFSGRDLTPGKQILKPQLKFTTPIDNTESHPFIPLLKEKPFALKPLEESMQMIPEDETSPMHYPQPYEYEIDHQEYNDLILQKKDPIPSTSWTDNEPIWVDTVSQLQSIMPDLEASTEIAVDLEHHDYRTYYGITCLMQISTRKNDYLIDTLALREDLQILNNVFANPMITKVFHGAFMDIIWLQRDLGLYVVGLFDTFHASRAMGLPKHSLAYLLEKFAQFKTSKKYQLADWRIRPLSKAMHAYARADTHFLLNIFDQMRNSLIEQNKLAGVLKESRNVAKRRFEYSSFRPKVLQTNGLVYSPIEKDDPWKTIMFQYNIPPQKEPLLKELYQWRDKIARRDDESPRFVMPNQLLVSLVAYTPIDAPGVVSVSNSVTDYVRSNSKILANLIKNCLAKMKDNKFLDNNVAEEGISVVPETGHDLSQKLTIHQLQNLKSKFQLLSDKFNNSVKTRLSNHDQLYLFDGISFADDVTIKYFADGKIQTTAEQYKERSEQFDDAMKQLEEVEYCIPVIEENKQTQDQDNIPPITVATNAEGQVNEMIEKPEDLDEVIVLRKTNKNKSIKNKPKNREEPELEIIDYFKTAKVLTNDKNSRGGRNNNGNKRKRFDPYSAANEGPAAPKKRKNVTRGKNVSFKR
ncbi:hypothetical protein NCAS_0H00860 [Naumovozyma castellii]|uniref:HRDC domain-containing protein n=1 Tax=Naumovozyma castellii TaxID=27288 RepID=G0VIR9_NAUCA|nr:hypothetical protein NCAS_0H00860 [Naumovozyma castellii CBS 4309]CCC71396.1 hypothetical protein NCAS_0H00860 [Naumovozyma castellii CBS 4309]